MSSLAAVFQIGSLGDSIVSIPSLLSLKKLLPDCSEYILVTAVYSSAKVGASDIFDMAWKPKLQVRYSGPQNRWKQLISVPAALAELRYYNPRYCVSLMPADREEIRLARDRSFFKAAGVRELIGFEPYSREQFLPSSDVSLETTEAFLRFRRLWKEQAKAEFQRYVSSSMMSPSAEARGFCDQWLAANRKHPDKRLIALSPFSNFPSKDLADSTVAAVASELSSRCDAEVILVGGRKDAARAAEILKSAPGLNGCGEFSIQQSAAVLQKCDFAVCADSGPMHLACALGIPTLAVFSRINASLSQWLPFSRKSTILYREVACAGCASTHCAVEGHPCINNISAEQIVIAAINTMRGLPICPEDMNGTKVLIW